MRINFKDMKTFVGLLLILILVSTISCENKIEKLTIKKPAATSLDFKANSDTILLTKDNKSDTVISFSFDVPDYGVDVVPEYSLQFDIPDDTSGEEAWGESVTVKISREEKNSKKMSGEDLNAIAVNQLGLSTGEEHKIIVRLIAAVNQNSGEISTLPALYETLALYLTPFKDVVLYPALLVKGGNSWVTPAERTNGFLLTSPDYNSKYEGYLYLPDADGYGGDAFTLISTIDDTSYGWGISSTTISESIDNLWLTPAPAYMKVNVDLDSKTIDYTQVSFSISGDQNGWSTSGTPMTLNQSTQQLELDNINFSAGDTFAFIANGSWDISYKVDNDGNLIFAGPPDWGGNNITVDEAGTYNVILDLSKGNGKYTYQLIKQ